MALRWAAGTRKLKAVVLFSGYVPEPLASLVPPGLAVRLVDAPPGEGAGGPALVPQRARQRAADARRGPSTEAPRHGVSCACARLPAEDDEEDDTPEEGAGGEAAPRAQVRA